MLIINMTARGLTWPVCSGPASSLLIGSPLIEHTADWLECYCFVTYISTMVSRRPIQNPPEAGSKYLVALRVKKTNLKSE